MEVCLLAPFWSWVTWWNQPGGAGNYLVRAISTNPSDMIEPLAWHKQSCIARWIMRMCKLSQHQDAASTWWYPSRNNKRFLILLSYDERDDCSQTKHAIFCSNAIAFNTAHVPVHRQCKFKKSIRMPGYFVWSWFPAPVIIYVYSVAQFGKPQNNFTKLKNSHPMQVSLSLKTYDTQFVNLIGFINGFIPSFTIIDFWWV